MIPHWPRFLSSRATAAVIAAIVSCATTVGSAHSRQSTLERAPTFDERVEAQRAIEQVYWGHRIWPEQNRQPKPQLSTVMPESALRAKVEDYLKKSSALESLFDRPITADQLQAEMNRMATHTRNGQLLGELFAALGNDPALIAETLARQALADRVLREMYAGNPKTQAFDRWWAARSATISTRITPDAATFALAAIATTGCAADSWAPLSTAGDDPTPRIYHAAVWTGAEMIVWGGRNGSVYLNTGGRYDPATDTWVATSTGPNDPTRRRRHAAVWTGSEMIVWGGFYQAGDYFYPTDGGRYDPSTDTWTATSTGANVPEGRAAPSAVWTGTEMVVWGGDLEGPPEFQTGARYNPTTNSWTPTSVGVQVPDPRSSHTAVWTGSEMVVWGGYGGGAYLQSGGRYDPSTDSWQSTSTGSNVPSARYFTASVWTGSEMVVWGGYGNTYLDTGGRYDPSTNTWAATSTGANVPQSRFYHTAVWTGTEMIVWSGLSGDGYVNTGARYCSCAAPVPAYRDADGDGYGNAGESIGVCGGSPPAGYVANATDCNDVSGAVHPGASESCNGTDDDCNGVVDDGGSGLCNDGNPCTDDACDGAAGCSHANNVSTCDDGNTCTSGDSCLDSVCNGTPVAGPPEVQSVTAAADKASFSWSAAIAATQYDVVRGSTAALPVGAGGDEACFDNLPSPSLTDETVPTSGTAFWYLSRGENACGIGTFGTRHDGTPRTTTTCP